VKTEQQIRERLAEIEADDDLRQPPATTESNAALALRQVSLEARQEVLHWILDN
jgi:vacuolar-type H+-ATPase subunit E/Vma4